MKVLVVNNQNKDIPLNFDSIFKRNGVEYEIINYTRVTHQTDDSGFDAVILTGTDLAPHLHQELFAGEISFIKKSKLPVLGICGGFLILAIAFDTEILQLSKAQYGKKKVNIVKHDAIFEGLDSQITLFVKHQYTLKNEVKGFETLAYSEEDHLIYAIKHLGERIMYGFQPHPERRNDGDVIMENFFKKIEQVINTKQYEKHGD